MFTRLNYRKGIFSVVAILMLLALAVGSSFIPPASAANSNPIQTKPPSTKTHYPPVEPQKLDIPKEPIPAQVIIQFAPNSTAKERAAYIKSIGGTAVKNIGKLNTVVINVPNAIAQASLPESAVVAQTEPDYYISALDDVIPNDPRYAEQWALPAIGAPSAWGQMPADAPKVTVAVIDSGICADHPDLAGRILDGWDFLESDAVPQDDFGHGCSVSGVIAANMNDGIGIAGVAPNAMIMPLRVLNAGGVGSYSDVAAAIVYAADNGAQVINLSLGGSNPSSTLESAVNYAISEGVIVVAAAGNNGTEGALYPAAYPDVIAVGSVDPDLQHSSFSNYGSQIDIWAPGRDILTIKRDGSHGLVSGTSFAGPYVAGAEVIQIALDRMLVFNGELLDLIKQVDEITSTPTFVTPTSPTELSSATSTPTIRRDLTSQEVETLHSAVQKIMNVHINKEQIERGYEDKLSQAYDNWVAISIWYLLSSGQPDGMSPFYVFAKKSLDGQWDVYAPWMNGYHAAITQLPDNMKTDDPNILQISNVEESLTATTLVSPNQGGFVFAWPSGTFKMGSYGLHDTDNTGFDVLKYDSLGNPVTFDILAPKDGEVIYANDDMDACGINENKSWHRNNYVVIGHGRKTITSTGQRFQFYTLYYHLSSNSIPGDVTPGRRVKTGQLIGRAGNTGQSTAIHLHFQGMLSVGIGTYDYQDCQGNNVGKRDVPYVLEGGETGFEEYGNTWPPSTTAGSVLLQSHNYLGYNPNECNPELAPVVLYEHRDYGGKCDYFNDSGTGEYPTLGSNVGINQASSVMTRLGYRVQLYQGLFFVPPYTEYYQDVPFLGDWSDRVGSLRVGRNGCFPTGASNSLDADLEVNGTSCGEPTPTPIPTQPTATLPPPSGGIEIVSVSSHVVKPGEQFNPSITIKHISGELVANRDHLHAIPEDASNLFGLAGPVQPLKSNVPIGGTYTFDYNNDSGFRMTAPSTPGQYQSVWQMRVGGVHIGPQAVINITVKADPITTPLPTPTIDCNNPPEGITLYEFPDFKGRCVNSTSDVMYLGNTLIGDNVASSLRVVGTWGVTLFRDPDWNGSWEEFQGNDNNLSDNQIGDNTVSSLRVWKPNDPCGTLPQGVTLYRGRDFTGISQSFSKDAQFFGNEAIGDNTVNSIRICGPYRVTLYRDPDWVGISEVFTGSDSNLTDNPINDPNATASSLRIIDGINACNTLGSGVTLYSETDFNGRSQLFSSDVQYLGNTAFGNDAAKSLRVCGHWTVTVFRDADWTGTWANFTGETRELALTTIGTSASSIRMVDSYDFCKTLGSGVTLYRGRDFTGIAQTFTRDASFLGNETIGNDTVTSIRQCGYNSTLYRDPDWQGYPETFTGKEESNLTDNQIGVTSSSLRVWTIPPTPWPTITPTLTPVPAKPDLVPYDGNGSFPLIPSSMPGDHLVGTLYAGQVTYLDWSIFNNSNVNVTTPFKVTLFLDGVQINQFSYTSLDADAYHGLDDWNIYVDTPGYHTLKITVDSNNEIAETNETNNSWEGSFYWNPKPVTCPTITDWKGEYWNNSNLGGSPILCRNDADLNFDWQYESPDPLIPSDHFSARWTRTYNFNAGTYRFHFRHDDGARFYVDDVLKRDVWDTCCVWETVDVELTAGAHKLRMDYLENSGAANVQLWWEQLPNYTLTVIKNGVITGTVTSNPAGINCPGDCSESYMSGTSVTLTATPAAESAFYGWSGACTGSHGCVIAMTNVQSVTATFSKPGDANNDGRVGVLDQDIWAAHYGTETLNGPADGDFNNDGFVTGGDLIIWRDNATIYTLTVNLAGTGNGTVTSNPAGITCPGDCSESYVSDTKVTLTANPSTGSTFSGWSGDADCSDGQVTMDASKTCIATLTSGAFNKINPPDGAINQPTKLGLSWETSPGASTYELCLDVIINDSCDTNWTKIPVTSATLPNLNLGTTYEWHVRAVNSGGTIYSNGNNPSAFWTFTTTSNPDLKPDLIIQSITLPPVQVNQAVTLSVVVKNQGQIDASGFWVDLFIDNPFPSNCSNLAGQVYTRVPYLAVGTSTTLSLPYAGFTAANHIINGIADAHCEVNESNENNNTKSINVLVLVTITGNAGIGGATLSYTDGTPKTVTSDGSGNYTITVPYGWSGTVTPYKSGYTFTPVKKTYSTVQDNQITQNYTATSCVSCADVNVTIGGNSVGGYTLASGDRASPRYGINGGPVRVVSTNGKPIFTSQRAIYGNSFNSIVGVPANQLTTEYWFTSLDDLGMITYLVIGNPSTTETALVDVYIAGNKMNPTPYSIAPGQRVFPRYGINGGPVWVVSTNGVAIFTSERTKYGNSFNEVLGYPANQLTTEYWFTSLDDLGMITYLVIGNPNTTETALVDVYIAGNKMNPTPYSIAPGQRVFPRYGINGGPVRVVSTNGVAIFTSERTKYGNSFNEVLGYAGNKLATEYWFTSLDDASMITYLVIGNPSSTLTAHVDVYINGVKINPTPYAIAPGQRVFPRYGVNSGAVRVVSDIPIFTSERTKYQSSFNEILGLPTNQLTTDYWFTSLDDLGMVTELIIAAP